jgi:hypothetical protein
MENVIQAIVNTPAVYPRFLNTLSLLEYVGARKILKSQSYSRLDHKLLAHAAEEIRHAQLLKRAAMKLSPDCATYDAAALICGKQAFTYFQAVDYAAIQVLNEHDPWHCYLYSTYLVEIRALEFYTAFEKVVRGMGKPSVFRGILAEEQRHLQDINDWLSSVENHQEKLRQLTQVENTAFEMFMRAVAAEVKHSQINQPALALSA